MITTLKTTGQRNSSAWPMAQRELRAASRRWANYWLRVGSGLAGTALLAVFLMGGQGSLPQTGGWLFLRLHCLVLALIIGIVPGMAADCIAREKREGTLGLLFLTPLTARGVIIGKSLAQALRGLTLWLAVLPVLTIPFVTGGVRWSDAFHMATIEFFMGVICLASGLAASALAKSRTAAFLLAYVLAGLLLAGVAIFEADLRSPLNPGGQNTTWGALLTYGVSMATGSQQDMIQGMFRPGARAGYLRSVVLFTMGRAAAGPGAHLWLVFLSTSALAAVLILYLAVSFGARSIQRSWKDKIPSLRQQTWARRFCAPLLSRWFGRRMQRSLDRNPIAWLQQYSWKARASKWGLCGAIILAESAIFGWYGGNNSFYVDLGFASVGLGEMQQFLTVLLAAVFTFIGVNSFLAEKRSGALELLLVTPVSVNQIILGRAWGLWKLFLPAGLILLLGECGFLSFSGISNQHWALGRGSPFFLPDETALTIFIAANYFVSLPIFATYAALRVKNIFMAAGLTWVGLFLVWLTAVIIMLALDSDARSVSEAYVAVLFCNAAYMALTFFLLRHSLSRRIYSF